MCADRYLALGAEWGGGSASRRRCRSAFASRADGGSGGGGTVQQCAKWERGGLEVQLHNRARLDVEGGVGGEKKCNLRSSPLSWSEGGNRKVRGKGFFHVYAKGTPYYNVSAEMFGKLQRTWPADGGNHQEMEIQSLILFHVRTVAFEWCWQEDRKVTNCERQVQLASDGIYSICSPSIFSSVLQVLQLLLFLFLVSGAASANCFLCFLLKKRHI